MVSEVQFAGKAERAAPASLVALTQLEAEAMHVSMTIEWQTCY